MTAAAVEEEIAVQQRAVAATVAEIVPLVYKIPPGAVQEVVQYLDAAIAAAEREKKEVRA